MAETFFNTLAEKYRCCCGCMHVATGTKIFCTLFLLDQIGNAIQFFVNGESGGIWTFIGIIISSIFIAGPLMGIKKTEPNYFIPFLCFLALSWIYYIGLIGCCILALFPDEASICRKIRDYIENVLQEHDLIEVDTYILTIILVIFGFFLYFIWVFYVIYKCYKYISDKKNEGYDKMVLPKN